MKILVVGIGHCGGCIADEFERLNKRAKSTRHIEIVTGTFAVDTDATALSELSSIKADYRRRILIGVQENRGRGAVAMSEIGAEIAQKEAEKVINAVSLVKRFPETDAILIVASGTGGTGSGALPIIICNMKERYRDKAVYGLIIFPFDREIQNEKYFISNMSSSLKSSYAVSDGIFLADNQKYVRQDYSLMPNMSEINQLIIEPFFNLLCAGEETKSRHVGSKLIDAGDIIQTIRGWTVLGHGQSQLSWTRRLLRKSLNFKKKSEETDMGITVMEKAISNLSIKCNPSDSASVLYLLSAPSKELTINLLEYLGDYMKNMATNAIMRSGDYPIRRGLISIDVILSQLRDINKIREIYDLSLDET